ncbi:hypothetical protein V1603_12460 [Enterobacter sp. ECC-219]|uniref:hypothetical protein n=1 Tax=Enterobacter sp. ECC-219 TaxID=3116480 RepID=UPI0037543C46
MVDFEKAFLTGLNSAKKASNNIEEINSVIKKMSMELMHLTKGKVKLGVSSFYEKDDNPLRHLHAGLKTYQGLAVFDGDGRNGVEIAKWTQHENGYPCSIASSAGKFYCKNKEDLESVIADLFMQTRTGKIILDKINKNR